MKKAMLISDIIASFFVLLFLYTALNKIADHSNFIKTMKKSELIGGYSTTLAWLIPFVEVIAVALLVLPNQRLKGLTVSFILMTIFTGYIGYMLAFATTRICQCGGVLYMLSWPQHFVFNIVCTFLAGAGIWLRRKGTQLKRAPEDVRIIS